MNIKEAGTEDWYSIAQILYSDSEDMTPEEEGDFYRELVQEHFDQRGFDEADYDAYLSAVQAEEDKEKAARDRLFWKALFG